MGRFVFARVLTIKIISLLYACLVVTHAKPALIPRVILAFHATPYTSAQAYPQTTPVHAYQATTNPTNPTASPAPFPALLATQTQSSAAYPASPTTPESVPHAPLS